MAVIILFFRHKIFREISQTKLLVILIFENKILFKIHKSIMRGFIVNLGSIINMILDIQLEKIMFFPNKKSEKDNILRTLL